jgi:cobalt/nickel transport system permease protein
VLVVQALLFSDGGLLALGANIFNMAFVSTIGGWFIYKLVSGFSRGLSGQITAVFFAAWCSVVLAALACAGELSFAGTILPGIVFPAMTGGHLLIGVGEGLITSLVILAIHKARPELVGQGQPPVRSGCGEFIFYGLLVTLGLALFVSPYASSWPDGLDKVAEKFGFAGRAAVTVKAWFADYKIPGVSSTALATGLAGLSGAVIMFVFAWVTGQLLVRERGGDGSDKRR